MAIVKSDQVPLCIRHFICDFPIIVGLQLLGWNFKSGESVHCWAMVLTSGKSFIKKVKNRGSVIGVYHLLSPANRN